MEKAGAVEPFRFRSWTFITNHAQVLLTVARHPEATVANAGRSVGTTATRSTRSFRSATRFWRTSSSAT
jgi:hypothetical protein